MFGGGYSPSSMTRLAGIAGVCGAAVCGAGSLAQAAAAERPLGEAMSRAAAKLSRIIRRDAARIGAGQSSGAVLARRCCGTRVLHVFYRARPYGGAGFEGAYELNLRFAGRFLVDARVSFFPTPPAWHYGAPPQREGPSYSFTLKSPNRQRGWRVSALDSYLVCPPAPQADLCEGSSQGIGFEEHHGDERELGALFRQAMRVARRAEHHRPITEINLFSTTRAPR